MPKTWRRAFLIGTLIAPLTACQTTGTQEGEGTGSVEDRARTAGLEDEYARARALEGAGAGAAGTWRGKSIDDPSSPLSKRVIYFDYDSDTVRDEYRPTLEAHAAYLSESRAARMRLEGHTDERGSREYNLGLGERRGQSVQRVMSILGTGTGTGTGQISVVSFGEERPAGEGQDESAWALDRRVEIVYGSR
jgi:peptidoglycan-associated lipoprotein